VFVKKNMAAHCKIVLHNTGQLGPGIVRIKFNAGLVIGQGQKIFTRVWSGQIFVAQIRSAIFG